MSETLFRHLDMLRTLTRQNYITTAEIEKILVDKGYSVTRRTIQRDLVNLGLKFPLQTKEVPGNRDRYWKFMDTAKVYDIAGLDPQSALTLKLMQAYLKPLVPAQTLRYLQPYMEQAEAILDDLGDNALGTWPDKVRVLQRGQPLLPPEIRDEVQDAIYQALLEDRQVWVMYRARGRSNYHERIVHPLALVVRDQVLYLVCTIGEYTDIRQMALHRMNEARVLDAPRARPANFDIDAYIASGEFGRPVGEAIRVTLRFNKAAALHLYETPLAPDQTIRERADQTFELTATVNNTDEFRRWLLGFGAAAKVVKPCTLRDEIQETVRQMLDQYGD